MEMNKDLIRARLLTSAATGLALLFTATSSTVYAQDADEDKDNIEEVVVTGIRASLKSSIEKKRASTSIVETITAEDIGKLPDVSIAESIARLPGLAAQRLDGRANVISIRGLAPDFTASTLNGREQVTAANNRGVEFDQYPSELMSGVTIYKTPDAGLMTQAIGGTIDMHTVRPLEHGERTISFGIRGEYNDLGALNSGTTATGYRASFSYIDQFADDTVGIALGYARMTSPTQEERWNSWGFPTVGDGKFDVNGDPVPADTLVIGGAKPFVKSNELTRDGLMGVLEYAPDDTFTSTIDVYYSKFNDDQRLRGVELPLAWSGAQLQDGMTVENGLVTEGVFNGVMGVMRNDVFVRDAETLSLGWNIKKQLNDQWSVEADANHNKVTRKDVAMESYSGTGRGSGLGATDNISFVMNGNGGATFTPSLDYADPNLFKIVGSNSWGDPLGGGTWDSQDGFINKPTVKDELNAIRMTAERQMVDSAFKSIEFGARYSEREKSLKDVGIYLTLKAYPEALTVPAEYALPATSLAFLGLGDMLSYDSLAFYNDGNYTETDALNNDISRATNSWYVKEKVFTAYTQANIDTEMGDVPVTGNIGLQAVHTNQSSIGSRVAIEDNALVVYANTGGDKYWSFLPSANFIFDVAEDQKLRLGIARTLARPNMSDMNSNFSFSYNPTKASSTDVNNSPWGGGGGNPQLRPWMAWQFDASYEKYIGDGGYVAVAGFYKKLENYVHGGTTVADFTGITVPAAVDQPAIYEGIINSPVNGKGGKIYGAELSATLPGSLVSDMLDGFGLIFSSSFTDSSVKAVSGGASEQLPGLSKTVVNTTVYYENAGFQARVSSRYRSDFLGEVSGLSLNRQRVFIKAENVFDAQIGYDFSEFGVEGLSAQFQVNNFTNKSFSTYQNGDKRQIRDFQNYGRTFLFGVTYRM